MIFAVQTPQLHIGVGHIFLALVVVAVGFGLYSGVLQLAKLIAPNLFPPPVNPELQEIKALVVGIASSLQTTRKGWEDHCEKIEETWQKVCTLEQQHKRREHGLEPWYCKHNLAGLEPRDNDILVELSKLREELAHWTTTHREWGESFIASNKNMERLLDALLKKLSG